jgi:hypothetical protein
MRWRGYTILDGEDDKLVKEERGWAAVVVCMGSIASLYVPVSDLNVLGELAEVRTPLPLARQGFGMSEDAVPLDDL